MGVRLNTHGCEGTAGCRPGGSEAAAVQRWGTARAWLGAGGGRTGSSSSWRARRLAVMVARCRGGRRGSGHKARVNVSGGRRCCYGAARAPQGSGVSAEVATGQNSTAGARRDEARWRRASAERMHGSVQGRVGTAMRGEQARAYRVATGADARSARPERGLGDRGRQRKRRNAEGLTLR